MEELSEASEIKDSASKHSDEALDYQTAEVVEEEGYCWAIIIEEVSQDAFFEVLIFPIHVVTN